MRLLIGPFTLICAAIGYAGLCAADDSKRNDNEASTVAGLEKSSAQADASGNLEIVYTVLVPLIETRIVKEGDKEKEVTVVVYVPETRTRLLTKGTFRVFDRTGKFVGPMAIAQLLKERRDVYVAHTDKLPDRKQLDQLPEGALLISKPLKPTEKSKDQP